MENGKLIALISSVAGFVIGVNWLKIKKWLPVLSRKIHAIGETKVDKIKEETQKAEKSILDALRNSPRGKTLAELGNFLGIPFVKLAFPIKNLVETKKVVKTEKIYTLSSLLSS